MFVQCSAKDLYENSGYDKKVEQKEKQGRESKKMKKDRYDRALS